MTFMARRAGGGYGCDGADLGRTSARPRVVVVVPRPDGIGPFSSSVHRRLFVSESSCTTTASSFFSSFVPSLSGRPIDHRVEGGDWGWEDEEEEEEAAVAVVEVMPSSEMKGTHKLMGTKVARLSHSYDKRRSRVENSFAITFLCKLVPVLNYNMIFLCSVNGILQHLRIWIREMAQAGGKNCSGSFSSDSKTPRYSRLLVDSVLGYILEEIC